MTTKMIKDQQSLSLKKLKRQKEVLEATIQKVEARNKIQESKAETRRNILLG